MSQRHSQAPSEAGLKPVVVGLLFSLTLIGYSLGLIPVVWIAFWKWLSSGLGYERYGWGTLGVVAFVPPLFLLILFGMLQNHQSAARNERQRRQREDHLASLGGGNARLGRQIEQCGERILSVEADQRALTPRLESVTSARRKLEASSFPEQAAPYQRAQLILEDHLRLRRDLLNQWHTYLRDLEALAAAGRAESALDGLPGHLELTETISAERERLERLTGELSAVAEVEQLLRA